MQRKKWESIASSAPLHSLRVGQEVLSSWGSYVRDQNSHASRKKKKKKPGSKVVIYSENLNREALSVF